MRLSDIAEVIDALKTQLAAMDKSIAALTQRLEEAKAQQDPLAAHIYRSRQHFRHCLEHDTKSGKRTEAAIRTSFHEAQKLGFLESILTWRYLLGAGT